MRSGPTCSQIPPVRKAGKLLILPARKKRSVSFRNQLVPRHLRDL